jgi:hypothetical protein
MHCGSSNEASTTDGTASTRIGESETCREPRGVRRHTLAVVLTLTACAVLTGATSLPAVGE